MSPIPLINYFAGKTLGDLAIILINTLLVIISVLAVGALIVGGYKYITSSSNPESTASAKSTVTWAIIGLILAFAAYVIVKFITERLT